MRQLTPQQIQSLIDTIAPANTKILAWIEDIIKSENKAQIDRRETDIRRLSTLLQKVRQQKDKYYEATINKEVPIEFCQAKIAECQVEENSLLEELKTVEETCDDYQQLGLLVHKLAYNAKEIYQRGSIEQKRLLICQIITNFTQNRSIFNPNWNLSGKYLSEWMPRLNKDYEQQKSLLLKGSNALFDSKINAWLPLLSEFRTVDWKKVQQELEFSGLLSLPLFAGIK